MLDALGINEVPRTALARPAKAAALKAPKGLRGAPWAAERWGGRPFKTIGLTPLYVACTATKP